MYKEFVPKELSLKLKEIGFDEPTSFYWEDDKIKPLPMKDEVGGFYFNRHSTADNKWICAPTINQVLRWFEKEHGMYVEWLIDMWGDNYKVSGDWICYTTFIWEVGKSKPKPHDEVGHGSWNAMALASINEMIFRLENLKDNNEDELIDKSIQYNEQQRRLIQMMQDDENDGLYENPTPEQ